MKATQIYLDQIKKLYKPITKTEQVELFDLYRNNGSEKAYNAIYYSVLNFVVDTALKFRNRGVELEDLIQAGNIGVDIAIKRFDPKKDVKFVSYAVNWITSEMRQEVAKIARPIKVITNDVIRFSNLKKATSKLEQKLFRTPTREEVAAAMELPVEDIELMVRMETQQSMDAEFDNSDSSTNLHNTLTDDKFMSPDNFSLRSIAQKVSKFVNESNLKNDRRKEIVHRHHGLGSHNPTSMEDIATLMNCSRQNIEKQHSESIKQLVGWNNSEKAKGNFHLDMEMIE